MFLWPENGEHMEVIEVILGCTRLTRTDSKIFKGFGSKDIYRLIFFVHFINITFCVFGVDKNPWIFSDLLASPRLSSLLFWLHLLNMRVTEFPNFGSMICRSVGRCKKPLVNRWLVGIKGGTQEMTHEFLGDVF